MEGRALRQAHLATRPTRTAGQLAQQIHPEGQLGLREKVPVEPGIEPGSLDIAVAEDYHSAGRAALLNSNR